MMSEYVFDPKESHYYTESTPLRMLPPSLFLFLYLQFSATQTDSPAALTEQSDCIRWLDKTMQVLFSFCLVCLMSKEA